jgi:N-acetylglucosamine kinase-like BadF-type ATPase
MSEYITFWFAKFIAELLWALTIFACLFIFVLLGGLYQTFQEWRENRVKIKKENTNNQSH